MGKKYSLILVLVLIVFITGFTSGYQSSNSTVQVYQSSEESLIQSVNQYAQGVVSEVDHQYDGMGVKANVGITDIKIKGNYALVSLVMEKYDPSLQTSYKSYHITQWQLREGQWVL